MRCQSPRLSPTPGSWFGPLSRRRYAAWGRRGAEADPGSGGPSSDGLSSGGPAPAPHAYAVADAAYRCMVSRPTDLNSSPSGRPPLLVPPLLVTPLLVTPLPRPPQLDGVARRHGWELGRPGRFAVATAAATAAATVGGGGAAPGSASTGDQVTTSALGCRRSHAGAHFAAFFFLLQIIENIQMKPFCLIFFPFTDFAILSCSAYGTLYV